MGEFAVDLFATKGLEYLIVIGYLAALVVVWRLIAGSARDEAMSPGVLPRLARESWLGTKESLYFHQGHAWMAPVDATTATVGIDGFAGSLLGPPSAIRLPDIGTELHQGEPAWAFELDGETVEMLSPVDGRVLDINADTLRNPNVAVADPYGAGWLMKVALPRKAATLTNLLTGPLARAWMDQAVEKLRTSSAGELGVVMTDGGAPVGGFARLLAPDGWGDLAREFLLTSRPSGDPQSDTGPSE